MGLALCFALVSWAACGGSVEPDTYTRLTIAPAELLVALGVSRPVAIEYYAIRHDGRRDRIAIEHLRISIRDTSYATLRGDVFSGHRFGRTYLVAEMAASGRGRLRDSIPIIVFEVR